MVLVVVGRGGGRWLIGTHGAGWVGCGRSSVWMDGWWRVYIGFRFLLEWMHVFVDASEDGRRGMCF